VWSAPFNDDDAPGYHRRVAGAARFAAEPVGTARPAAGRSQIFCWKHGGAANRPASSASAPTRRDFLHSDGPRATRTQRTPPKRGSVFPSKSRMRGADRTGPRRRKNALKGAGFPTSEGTFNQTRGCFGRLIKRSRGHIPLEFPDGQTAPHLIDAATLGGPAGPCRFRNRARWVVSAISRLCR
jgi:hypothetical protein